MGQVLYDHPAVYDALSAGTPYDEEVGFVLDRAPGAERALVVGCATGEHARRLAGAGLEVVGVDPHPAMIERAREKSDVEFCVGSLPALPIGGGFDLVVAPSPVVNRLASDELEPALFALAERVTDEGVLILETGDFPEMDAPALQTAGSPEGDCARLYRYFHLGDRRMRMDAIVFHGESWFVDRHELTAFEDEWVGIALTDLGFVVKREDWYTDRITMADPSVFVARR